MKNLYCLILTSIAGLSTVLGNILLIIDKKFKRQVLSFSLGLSFSVMFTISILELIPEGIKIISKEYSRVGVFFLGLICLILGMIIINLFNNKIDEEDHLYKVGFLSMISLLIHNIPEGIICAITTYHNFKLGLKMTLIILLHNIPEGICISLPIYYSTNNYKKAIFYTIISGFGEILGTIITILFLKKYISDILIAVLLFITAGIMINLSINKILKEALRYNKLSWITIGTITGIIICLLSV